MQAHPLTLADTLRALREDIQAENTLIASRVTWYVTSQALVSVTPIALPIGFAFLWLYAYAFAP